MKKIILTLLVLLSPAFSLTPAIAGAASTDPLFSSCSQAPTSSVCTGAKNTNNPVVHIIKVASNIVAILAGVAAVIIIIIGGVSLVTSSGNTEAVANARKRITSALIGLIVIALSWTIIAFVTDKLIK